MKLITTFLMLMLATTSFAPGTPSNLRCVSDEDDRIRITKEILENLVQQRYEDVQKDFHVTLKQVLPPEKLSEIWSTMVNTFGAYKDIISVRAEVFQGYNQIKIRCQFELEKATLEATFTEDDKVYGLYFKP